MRSVKSLKEDFGDDVMKNGFIIDYRLQR